MCTPSYMLCTGVLHHTCFAQVLLESWYWSSINAKLHSEPSQTSKMELFVKMLNDWKTLTIFVKSFIWDVWLRSEYIWEMFWYFTITLSSSVKHFWGIKSKAFRSWLRFLKHFFVVMAYEGRCIWDRYWGLYWTLTSQCCLLYRNQVIDLHCESAYKRQHCEVKN